VCRMGAHVGYIMGTSREIGIGRSDPIAIKLPYGAELAVMAVEVPTGAMGALIYPAGPSANFAANHSVLKVKAIPVEAGETSPRLEAMVGVPRRGAAFSQPKLREFLGLRLADYIVLAVSIIIDALRVTPTGRISLALLAQGRWKPELETLLSGPKMADQELVAGMSAEVLGLAQARSRTTSPTRAPTPGSPHVWW
jgi:hypothetical protein